MSSESIYKKIETLEQEIITKKKQLANLRKSVPERQVENYQFVTTNEEKIHLLELFGDKDELIVIHNMGKSCSYCTMWADGFNGVYEHLTEKAAFALSSPDSPEVQAGFAAARGWKFPIVSTAGTTFMADFEFEKNGHYYPGVSTFRKDNKGNMYHHAKAPLGPGDDYNVVWHLFDLLPSGSKDFHPKLKYDSQSSFHLTNNVAVQVQHYNKAITFYENILGMKRIHDYGDETRFSIGNQNLFIEEGKNKDVFFEFAVRDFHKARGILIAEGCKVTQEYNEKSVMIADPFGMKYHLFEL